MGWSCSWIAVRGKSESAVLGALGMERTGQQEAMPESPWTIANLPGAYLLIFCANHCAPASFCDSVLKTISAGGELVHGSVEEHVMFSSAACWQNGEKHWSVAHDAQNGVYDLEAWGRVPASFETIRQDGFSAQQAEGGEEADVDLIFDIPLRMGAELTGFRHDECLADDEGPYAVLTRIAATGIHTAGRKPWWRPW